MTRRILVHRLLRRVSTLLFVGLVGITGSAVAAEATQTHFGCSSDRECTAPERCETRPTPVGSYTWGDCTLTLASGLRATGCLTSKRSPFCGFNLEGPITAEQVTALDAFTGRYSDALARTHFYFTLDSDGGDVDAAMALGRFVRSKRGKVNVLHTSTCASACVFVLAGGVDRLVEGPVVIHRPYRAAAETYGYDDAQADFQQRGLRIRAYLEEMNVSSSLYEAMLAVPSESGRRLTREELAYYRIGQDDPVWAEERNAAEAKRRGLSMPEYLQRMQNVDQCLLRMYSQNYDSLSLDEELRARSQCNDLWNH